MLTEIPQTGYSLFALLRSSRLRRKLGKILGIREVHFFQKQNQSPASPTLVGFNWNYIGKTELILVTLFAYGIKRYPRFFSKMSENWYFYISVEIESKIRKAAYLSETEKKSLLDLLSVAETRKSLYVDSRAPLTWNYLQNILREDKAIIHELSRRSYQIVLPRKPKSTQRVRGYRDHGTLPENWPNQRPKQVLTNLQNEIETEEQNFEKFVRKARFAETSEDLFLMNPQIFDKT